MLRVKILKLTKKWNLHPIIRDYITPVNDQQWSFQHIGIIKSFGDLLHVELLPKLKVDFFKTISDYIIQFRVFVTQVVNLDTSQSTLPGWHTAKWPWRTPAVLGLLWTVRQLRTVQCTVYSWTVYILYTLYCWTMPSRRSCLKVIKRVREVIHVKINFFTS